VLKKNQACFALLTDKEFKATGHLLHINYCKDYYKYLNWLCQGLETCSKPIVELFKDWNITFFRERITKRKSKEADADYNAALADLEEAEKVASDNDQDSFADEDNDILQGGLPPCTEEDGEEEVGPENRTLSADGDGNGHGNGGNNAKD
jgi:hypothetical protein